MSCLAMYVCYLVMDERLKNIFDWIHKKHQVDRLERVNDLVRGRRDNGIPSMLPTGSVLCS